MENFVIGIKTATLAIFDEPSVKEKSDKLFETYKEDIESKIKEILDFLNLMPSNELSYENITALFKTNFHMRILNTAVAIACSNRKQYNLLENVLSLLSDKKMISQAIRTEPMLEAVIDALYNIPRETALETAKYGSLIFRLNRKYRESNILSLKKDITEQRKYCGECGCSCVCDESCGGDTNKCTSKTAVQKKCTHHCDCWIKPFVEKHKDEFDITIKTGSRQKE